MKNNKLILISSLLLSLSLSVVACKNVDNKKYTYEKLNAMPDMELYDLFLANGLEVDEDLQKTLTKDQLAEIFKADFELLVKGVSSRSHIGYMKIAKDTKIIYEKLIK